MKRITTTFAALLCGNALLISAQQRTMNRVEALYHISLLPTEIAGTELSDTATVVSFRSYGSLSDYQALTKEVYLCDENGKKHYARYGVNITMGEKKYMGDDGSVRYSLVFDAIDSKTKAFDVIDGRYPSYFSFYGIHDSSKPLVHTDLWSSQLPVIPEMKNIKTGKAQLSGQINKAEGTYEPFLKLSLPHGWPFYEEKVARNIVSVDTAGHFAYEVELPYPRLLSLNQFRFSDFHSNYIFLQPGKKSGLTLSGNEEHRWDVSATYPRGTRYTQLLQHLPADMEVDYFPFNSSTPDKIGELRDALDKIRMSHHRLANYIAAKYRFSDEEKSILRSVVDMTDLSRYFQATDQYVSSHCLRPGEAVNMGNSLFVLPDSLYAFLSDFNLDDPHYLLTSDGDLAVRELEHMYTLWKAPFPGWTSLSIDEVAKNFATCDSLFRVACGVKGKKTPVMIQAAILYYFLNMQTSHGPAFKQELASRMETIITDPYLRKVMKCDGKVLPRVVDSSSPTRGKADAARLRDMGIHIGEKIVEIVSVRKSTTQNFTKLDNILADFKDSPDIDIYFVCREGDMSQTEFDEFCQKQLVGAQHCLRLSDRNYYQLVNYFGTIPSMFFDGTILKDGSIKRYSLNISNEYYFRKDLRQLLVGDR